MAEWQQFNTINYCSVEWLLIQNWMKNRSQKTTVVWQSFYEVQKQVKLSIFFRHIKCSREWWTQTFPGRWSPRWTWKKVEEDRVSCLSIQLNVHYIILFKFWEKKNFMWKEDNAYKKDISAQWTKDYD